jgi:hypothetical protein
MDAIFGNLDMATGIDWNLDNNNANMVNVPNPYTEIASLADIPADSSQLNFGQPGPAPQYPVSTIDPSQLTTSNIPPVVTCIAAPTQ